MISEVQSTLLCLQEILFTILRYVLRYFCNAELAVSSEESSSVSLKNYTVLTLKGKLLNCNNCIFTNSFIKIFVYQIKSEMKLYEVCKEEIRKLLKVADLSHCLLGPRHFFSQVDTVFNFSAPQVEGDMLNFLLLVPVSPSIYHWSTKGSIYSASLTLKHLVLLTVWISQAIKFCLFVLVFFNDF